MRGRNRSWSSLLIRPVVLMLAFLMSFFVMLPTARAFILLPDECRAQTDRCIEAGILPWVFIYQRIEGYDAEFFKRLDQYWPGNKPFPIVYVESYGGKGAAGRDIGRLLHARQAIIATGNPILKIDRGICQSACAEIALGAAERHMTEVGFHMGAHTLHFGRGIKTLRSPTGSGNNDELMKYLAVVDANPQIIQMIAETPFDKISTLDFNRDLPAENQKIVQLGFHMPPSERFPDEGFTQVSGKEDRSSEEVLQFAVDQGNVHAAVKLADLFLSSSTNHKPDVAKARHWLEYAADRGDASAMHGLAVHLQYGHFGYFDLKKAVDYYQSAAELGFSGSQAKLGWLYHLGQGVPHNEALAIYWVTQSAEQGEFYAYGYLCQLYNSGLTFPKDYLETYKWCALAIDKMPEGDGRNFVATILSKVKKRLTPKQLEKAKLRMEHWQPAKEPYDPMASDREWW